MVKFESDLSVDELKDRWDEYTSPARFAGSDDTMDLIFVSKRKNEKVRLVRRARTALDPFASVFRGAIKKTERGSEIVGIFTKSWFDYAVMGLIIALLFYIRSIVDERGSGLGTINGLLVIAIVSAMLLLSNRRSSKRRYADFIFRITGKEMDLFLTRREQKELEKKEKS